MTITVTNTFHERSINLKAVGSVCAPSLPYSLTASQQRKVAALCGHRDCQCHQHIATVDGRRAGYEVGAGDDGRWLIVEF